MSPDDLDALGLGLEKDLVHLDLARAVWADAGEQLSAEISELLGDHAQAVEAVGSAVVAGLLCKPILDVAVLLAPAASTDEVSGLLGSAGWEYRGDAGSGGGHVFVLEARPRYRVAHLHVIEDGDVQWRRYLTLRDRLRTDPEARDAYGAAKRQLALDHPTDRAAYTNGKDEVVTRLRG